MPEPSRSRSPLEKMRKIGEARYAALFALAMALLPAARSAEAAPPTEEQPSAEQLEPIKVKPSHIEIVRTPEPTDEQLQEHARAVVGQIQELAAQEAENMYYRIKVTGTVEAEYRPDSCAVRARDEIVTQLHDNDQLRKPFRKGQIYPVYGKPIPAPATGSFGCKIDVEVLTPEMQDIFMQQIQQEIRLYVTEAKRMAKESRIQIKEARDLERELRRQEDDEAREIDRLREAREQREDAEARAIDEEREEKEEAEPAPRLSEAEIVQIESDPAVWHETMVRGEPAQVKIVESRIYVKQGGEIFKTGLRSIETLSPELARDLPKHDYLDFYGLESLSAEAAQAIPRDYYFIGLGVKSISAEAMRALSEGPTALGLEHLEKLPPKVALAISRDIISLAFSNLQFLPVESAQALPQDLEKLELQDFPLSVESAQALPRGLKELFLGGNLTITQEFLQALPPDLDHLFLNIKILLSQDESSRQYYSRPLSQDELTLLEQYASGGCNVRVNYTPLSEYLEEHRSAAEVETDSENVEQPEVDEQAWQETLYNGMPAQILITEERIMIRHDEEVVVDHLWEEMENLPLELSEALPQDLKKLRIPALRDLPLEIAKTLPRSLKRLELPGLESLSLESARVLPEGLKSLILGELQPLHPDMVRILDDLAYSGCRVNIDGLRLPKYLEKHPEREYSFTYDLLGTEIRALVFENGPGLTYFNMHDNEDTAAAVGRRMVEERGGKFIELQHSGKRNIFFTIGGETYRIDPNRIFTAAGVSRSLRDLNEGYTYTEEVERAVIKFSIALRDDLKLRRPQGGIIVAMHNNTEGRYSAASYETTPKFMEQVADVNVNSPEHDPDDFFFVTKDDHFKYLKTRGYNVVLQNRDAITDDGSLSVWSALSGVAYINVETQHGHEDEQYEMALVIEGMLR